MQHNTKTNSRKKFLLWGSALVASFTALRFFSGKAPSTPPAVGDTVKMLTQDGQLVEIDKTLLAATGNKISHDDIHDWIKK
jgi:hypothetical protein